MPGVFEVDRYDAAGRLGSLEIPRAGQTVQTPVLLPVVNPHVQTVPPARLSELGVQMLITNSYVLHGSEDLREPALERGLADVLGFDGPIMTDSGSYQLAEYGDIDVGTEEILSFQAAIGSDVGTPVDIPTPPDVGRDRAEREWETTRERLQIAAEQDTGDMLVTAPVQGATFPDIRERAGTEARRVDLDIYPVGGMVPLLREYRFAELVDVVAAAKRGLGEAVPVHLFGAGHPMMFALAAALGCDLFDSAAYALYARDGRYLTVRGTEHLADLTTFPCECPVCTAHEPAALQAMDESADERQHHLAEHNLHVSLGEMRRVRQAIRRGNLLELVETRARSHPAMLDGYRTLLDHSAQLEATDPVTKDAFFYVSAESARRPEVRRHHERLTRVTIPAGASVVVTEGGHAEGYDESWGLKPPFGPVPPELAGAYPLAGELPDRTDRAALDAAVTGVIRVVEANPEVEFALYHDDWPSAVLGELPDSVTVERIEQDTGSKEN